MGRPHAQACKQRQWAGALIAPHPHFSRGSPWPAVPRPIVVPSAIGAVCHTCARAEGCRVVGTPELRVERAEDQCNSGVASLAREAQCITDVVFITVDRW